MKRPPNHLSLRIKMRYASKDNSEVREVDEWLRLEVLVRGAGSRL